MSIELTISGKTCIKVAIAVIAHNNKVAKVICPSHNYFPITLNCNTVTCIEATKIRGKLAVSGETCIQSSITVVANNCNVTVTCTRHNYFPIALNSNTVPCVGAAKIRGKLAVSGEACI